MIVLSLRKKTLYGVAVSLLACVVLAVLFRFGTEFFPVAATGLKPVYAVEKDEKVLAISFDASWGAEHTEDILAVLKKNEVKTTFFLVNLWIEEYPELVKEIAAAGHEIELHSATHPHLTELSAGEIKKEIESNAALVKKVTGKESTLFRPPYGDYNDEVIGTIASCGLTAVQWSVDSLDWQGLSAAEIEDRVLRRAAPGAIVLLHNNGENTAEALQTLLPRLKEKGYKIVPVGELLPKGETYVDVNGMMRKADHKK